MYETDVDRREWEWVKGRSSEEDEGNDCDNEDRPRPVGGEEALWMMGGLPFGFPTPPLPCLTSRIARAPKLSRRANGVAGLLLAEGPKSSSKGLSSTEPELALEMLSVRVRGVWRKGEVWPGEAPRPIVVSESLRRWALAAAVVMGPEDCCTPDGRPAMLFDRPNRSWNVWLVTEARRRGSGEWRGGEFRSLEDIVGEGDADQFVIVYVYVCVFMWSSNSRAEWCEWFAEWNKEYREERQGGWDD